MPDHLAGFIPARAQPIDQQIADFLRRQIATGALPPGSRLPPTGALAKQWGVPIARIQSALLPLVREGLLLRRQRVGTVVCGQPPAITRIGLYRGGTQGWSGRERFAVRLEAVLSDKFAALGIATTAFRDQRPETECTCLMPELERALRTRAINALIACEPNQHLNKLILRLPIPIAGCARHGIHGFPNYDFRHFASAGIACLAARGCRSAGLISVAMRREPDAESAAYASERLPEWIRLAGAEHGVATADAWIRTPTDGLREADAERFGYDSMQSLWAGAERPDGLLVYTDLAARGVVMGLLAVLDDDSRPPALVLHRNSEIGLFCPLPADFLEASLERMADALWSRIVGQRQAHSDLPGPLPFKVISGMR